MSWTHTFRNGYPQPLLVIALFQGFDVTLLPAAGDEELRPPQRLLLHPVKLLAIDSFRAGRFKMPSLISLVFLLRGGRMPYSSKYEKLMPVSSSFRTPNLLDGYVPAFLKGLPLHTLRPFAGFLQTASFPILFQLFNKSLQFFLIYT